MQSTQSTPELFLIQLVHRAKLHVPGKLQSNLEVRFESQLANELWNQDAWARGFDLVQLVLLLEADLARYR